jgi:hypothetical protein
MTRSRTLSLLLTLSLAPFAAACGTTEAAPPKPNMPRASTTLDYQALCVTVFTKNRTCTDTYIPALVDMRAKHDVPAGIADEVKANRDGVIAQAKQEWASESTDDGIAATCQKVVASLDDAMRAGAEAANACVAKPDCADYTACIAPVFEKRFTK